MPKQYLTNFWRYKFNIVDVIIFFAALWVISSLSPFKEHQVPANTETIYALSRLLYVLLLVVAQAGFGRLILSNFIISPPQNYGNWDRFILNFLCGTLALKVIFYCFGKLGYLTFEVSILFFLIGLISSERHSFTRTLLFLKQDLYSRVFKHRNFETTSFILMVFTIILSWLELGLIPLDGDFLSHYGQFLMKVAQSGEISPNEVWYQYLYSKSDSLGVASIVIADNAGKLDVSTSYLFLTYIILWRILDRININFNFRCYALSTLALVLMLSDSGALAKHHMYVIFSMLALVFCMLEFNRVNFTIFKYKYAVGIFSASALAVTSTLPSIAFCYIILFAYFIYSIVKKELFSVYTIIVIGLSITLIMAYLCLDNYLSTGFLEINPFRLFINMLNYEIFTAHYTPYIITFLEQGSKSSVGGVQFDIVGLFKNIVNITRIREVMNGGLIPVVVLAIWGILTLFYTRQPFRSSSYINLSIILSISVICSGLLAYSLIGQPVSVIRATAFTSSFTILILFFFVNFACTYNHFLRLPACYLIFASLVLGSILNFPFAQWKYASSQTTIDQLYSEKRLISPSTNMTVRLKETYGGQIRILALNLISNSHGRGFLMGNGIISEVSYDLGHEWVTLAFEDSVDTLPILDKVADVIIINLRSPTIGLLPYSDLFSPNSLGSNFVSIITDKNWHAIVPKTSPYAHTGSPISEVDLNTWHETTENSSYKKLWERMRSIYNHNKKLGTPKNVRPLIPEFLPLGHTWQ